MSVSGIHGQQLEVTVVACNKLKDTEWISRQDPYVVLEYSSTKFRTRTCTDGHKNPTFQEKFVVTLIEGLRELSVTVWNSNTLTYDDFIGSGKIQLQKVLSQGYDDNSWTLQTKTGRYAGEIRLILHYASHNKPAANHSASAPPYMAPRPLYQPPPTSISGYPPPVTAYSAPPSYPPSYPPSSVAYPQPGAAPYPPSAYPPQNPSAYPASPYPPPPSAYPPPMYPPPPHGSSHYPPGPYPGAYPPPPPPYY